jgi:acyl carrier protein
MSGTRARLVEVFGAVFPGLAEAEIPKASPESVSGWDSLASATLLTVLEEEFGVDIPPEDADQLVSFERVLAYLERQLPV